MNLEEITEVSERMTCLEDYTTMEREGFAQLWDTLARQAKTDGERARRVRIAHDWRHSKSGMLRDFRHR